MSFAHHVEAAGPYPPCTASPPLHAPPPSAVLPPPAARTHCAPGSRSCGRPGLRLPGARTTPRPATGTGTDASARGTARSARPGPVRRGSTVPLVTGAAFFDLDRTLLAGASGTVYSEAMRDSGFVGVRFPARSCSTRSSTRRRDAAVDGARPAGRHVRPGRPRDAMREAGDAAAGTLAAMIQPFAWPPDRRAPRGGSPGRHRHHDAVRPRRAARRLARLRRRDRHALRRERRRHVRRQHRRARSCGRPGKLAAVRDWAGAPRRRPRRELGLLRQRVRHAHCCRRSAILWP